MEYVIIVQGKMQNIINLNDYPLERINLISEKKNVYCKSKTAGEKINQLEDGSEERLNS